MNSTHPAQRFAAPSSIQRGIPLKELMGRELIALIGESLHSVAPKFNVRRFTTTALRNLADLELKERGQQIADAMAEQLPADFDDAAPLLIQSFGPPLSKTDGNGLAPFFYYPHSFLVARHGVKRFENGMAVNYELTQRFTAEFSVRPFLIEHRARSLKTFIRWAKDPSAHVRRLVSEGSRPRLPWAMRLPEFQAEPSLSLPLLELLKDDPDLYVRRSVANHLGDMAKDHPDVMFDVCERWLEEQAELNAAQAANRRWVIRHALRHPAKKLVARGLDIRTRAAASIS